MIAASISHLSHSTSKNTYILYTNSRAVAVNGGHVSLHRAQWFGTRYRISSRATHRHVTGFVAAADLQLLLLLLVLPDSDRAEHDSDSPRQLELEPGSDPERHSMSLSKFSQCFTQFVCCNCYERDQIFDMNENTSIFLYPDIAPISCTTSKFLPSISLYHDIVLDIE